MAEHRLDPLLQPTSIALLGASQRTDSPGRVLSEMVINSHYPGSVYPVNPGYTQILGLPCYADLAALPETVDHVIIATRSSVQRKFTASEETPVDNTGRSNVAPAAPQPEPAMTPTAKAEYAEKAKANDKIAKRLSDSTPRNDEKPLKCP